MTESSTNRMTAGGERVASASFAACPSCPVQDRCGACSSISVPYAQQLERKQERIIDLFDGMLDSDCVVDPIAGMEHPYFYRNKVTSPFAPGRKLPPKAGKAKGAARGKQRRGKDARSGHASRPPVRREILTGMYAAGTHRLINTDCCLIENEIAKQVVVAVRQIMSRFDMAPYDEDTGTGFLRTVVVRVARQSGEVLVTLVTNSREFPASKAFCRQLVSKVPAVTTVVQNINLRQTNVILGQEERTLYGPGFILDTLCGLSFRISSGSFYQVNVEQAEVLYTRAIDFAALEGHPGCTVMDAYCGTGTIGLVAARRAGGAHVIGVDSVASAIRDARENARHNGIENAEFIAEDAGVCMRRMAAEGRTLDCLLMDPPRSGSDEAFLESALLLAPERIVYISCNPQTQARDAAVLLEGGYRIARMQPVDMFPHTDHIENILLFVKA